jgi:F-type H+-transporting ATPase subunit b
LPALLLAAAHGAAAHGAEHAEVMAINWLPSVTALVVFLTALGILYIKVWPQITRGLDERERKIRDEIRSAEEAREQARAALAEYERNLASAREEANAMIVRAKSDAKAAADDLRARNQQELAELKQRATREIDSAKHAAIAELHGEAASLAAAIAARILQREISVADQQRLVDDSLRELAGVNGKGNR